MTRIKVAVTGASGRTGRLVVQRLLLESDKYEPLAVVRSSRAAEEMTALFVAAAAARSRSSAGDGQSNANNSNNSNNSGSVHVVDFALGLGPDTTEEQDERADSEAERKLRTAFRGCRAVVVASGAVAEPKAWASLASAAHVAGSRLLSAALGRAAPNNAAFVPVATWKGGQAPYAVDWLGSRRIFRAFFAAVAEEEQGRGERERDGSGGGGGGDQGCGGHVVLISSAGGCDPQHFLNRIAGGEVLNWKRRAEMDLIRMCSGSGGAAAARRLEGGGGGVSSAAAAGFAAAAGAKTKSARSPPPQMTYTILHPNHLIDGGHAPKPGALPRCALEFFDPSPSAAAKGGGDKGSLPRQRMLLAVDDALQRPHWSRRPRVPRAALAELAIQSVALARPAGGRAGGAGGRGGGGGGGGGGWCRWGAPGPSRNRSIDVGVAEGKAVAAAAAAVEAGVAEAAAAAAEAEAEAGEAASNAGDLSGGGMTRLFAALLRAMPRNCDYGINDRTPQAGDGGLKWACR